VIESATYSLSEFQSLAKQSSSCFKITEVCLGYNVTKFKVAISLTSQDTVCQVHAEDALPLDLLLIT